EADRDGHVCARGEVRGMEADAVHGGRDREDVGGRQARRAPEALVPVPGGRVDDVDAPVSRAHAGRTRNRTAPASTSSAFSTQTSATVPTTPAGTGFIIFITSMRQTTVSASTVAPTSTNGGAPGAGAR